MSKNMMLKRILGKAGSIYATKVAPNAKSFFQVGVPGLTKAVGTGAKASAIGAGVGFSAFALGKGIGGGLEEVGIKKYTSADAMRSEIDAMNKMTAAKRSAFDEALREQKIINNTPTQYGGLGPYGATELAGRDFLLRNGMTPYVQTKTEDNKSGFNWAGLLLIGGAAAAGYYFLGRK